MFANVIQRSAVSAIAFSALFVGRSAVGQILNVVNADMQAYFTGSSDTNQFSDPTGASWSAAGFGLYGVTGVPNVPAPPAAPLYPLNLTPANSFLGTYTSVFSDSPASAFVSMAPGAVGGGNVSDATPQAIFKLVNPSGSYAFEQVDLEVDYLAMGAMGGLGALPTFLVSGVTSGSSSYAQFAGRLEYWWAPVNTAGVPTGSFSSLGTLEYNWSILGTATFTVLVTPSSSTLIPSPAGGGLLAVVGELYVAGDPAEINVSSVPEPSSLALMGLGVVGFVMLAIRRRANIVCSLNLAPNRAV